LNDGNNTNALMLLFWQQKGIKPVKHAPKILSKGVLLGDWA